MTERRMTGHQTSGTTGRHDDAVKTLFVMQDGQLLFDLRSTFLRTRMVHVRVRTCMLIVDQTVLAAFGI